MRFGEVVKAIKDRLSLVDIAGRYCNLKANGSRYVAPCPFHQETKPSFYVFADKSTFYCFGCQASGDIIDFYSRVNGLDFRDSVLQLAEEAGVHIDSLRGDRNYETAKQMRTEKQTMLALHEAAASWYNACLGRPDGAECREYMQKRGLSASVIERFGLGWASRQWHSLDSFLKRQGYDLRLAREAGLLGCSANGSLYDRFRGRLMFPIRNLSNQVIAFGGRIITREDEAKYINSADTPIYSKKEHLYGLAQARRGIAATGRVLLTEGYMDVLTLHQFGYENSVGALGTALTEEQICRLSGFTSHIELLFDGDDPGKKAALRAAGLLLCRGLDCSVILLPDNEDIDSLLRGAGSKAFEELRRGAPSGFTYCIRSISQLAPREAIAWVRDFIAKVQLPEMKSHYVSQFAQSLGFAEDLFREGLTKQAGKVTMHTATSGDLCERDTQIMLFLVRYPEKLETLREMGADMALTTERARSLWELIEEYGPEEVVYHLDDKQRSFWQTQRGPQAPPRDRCELELNCLKNWLEQFYARNQAASLQAALASKGKNFAADLEFLHAIRDTMRKDNEQS